jgi:hypothetical protein
MNFLNDYKGGGDRSDKTGSMGGYTYLSKKDEQDLVLELKRVFIKISENPQHPGKEKALFVFRVDTINSTTQEDLEVGDEVSFMIDLQPANDMAVEPARSEFVSILASVTQTSAKDYWKSLNNCQQGDVSLVEEHLEDDCAIAQGNLVHVTTPDKPNGKGWYSLEWVEVGSAKGKSKPKTRARKAS